MIRLIKKSLPLILCTICSVCFAQGSLTFNPSILDTRIQQASAKLRNVFVKALLWC